MNRRRWTLLASLPFGTAILLALPSPAYAATGITSPANGTVYESDTTVHISATPNQSCPGSLSLQFPDGTTKTLRTFNASLSPSPVAYDFATAGQLNGIYTVLLKEAGTLCSARTYTSKFTLQIPGATPQNLQATSEGSGDIALAWDAVSGSQIVGYDVVNPDNGNSYLTDSNGNRQLVPNDSNACSNGSCSVVLAFDPGTAATYKFAVKSERDCPECATDPVPSAASNTASATVVPPSSPSPSPTTSGSSGGSGTPSPSASGSSGGTAPGTTTGSTPAGGSSSGATGGTSSGTTSSGTTSGGAKAAAVPRQPAVVFHVGSASPALNPGVQLPGSSTVVKNGPTPWGTYKPTLPYPSSISVEDPTVAPDVAQGPLHRVASAFSNPLSPRHLARSAAAALVLLVLAAHVWAWAFSPSRD